MIGRTYGEVPNQENGLYFEIRKGMLTRKFGSIIRTLYMFKHKIFLHYALLTTFSTCPLAQSNIKTNEDNYDSASSPEIPFEEISDFVQIFNKIKDNYVEV